MGFTAFVAPYITLVLIHKLGYHLGRDSANLCLIIQFYFSFRANKIKLSEKRPCRKITKRKGVKALN